jgi:glutathione peroxidase-family protein
MSSFHELTMDSIAGDPVSFDRYKGQASLVVNVASR